MDLLATAQSIFRIKASMYNRLSSMHRWLMFFAHAVGMNRSVLINIESSLIDGSANVLEQAKQISITRKNFDPQFIMTITNLCIEINKYIIIFSENILFLTETKAKVIRNFWHLIYYWLIPYLNIFRQSLEK